MRHLCCRRTWLPERVQSAPLSTLHLPGKSRRRVAPPTCTAQQPATDADIDSMHQHWCRPLSGCAADNGGASGEACGLGSSSSSSSSAAGAGAGVLAPQPAPQLPPIVALGKFDALHKGHRALAAAAAQLGGAPWLVSFSGMAEVLGWPARLPLVAPCDRRRVLAGWAQHCEGHTPRECAVPFAEVRSMTPEAFVELLAAELRVAGVVVGSNYRFGYRAAGTAQLLQQLGPQHGLRVRVLGLVTSQSQQEASAAALAAIAAGAAASSQQQGQAPALEEAVAGAAAASGVRQQAVDAQHAQQQGQQRRGSEQHQRGAAEQRRQQQQHAVAVAVSSTRVRHALGAGDMADAADCLGRRYRLVASLAEAATSALPGGAAALRLPAAGYLNQPPCCGRYAVEVGVTGADTLLDPLLPPQRAMVAIDETGLSVHGAGNDLAPAALAPDARHLTLDFL